MVSLLGSFRLRIPYQTAMPIECLSLYLQMIKATYNQSVLIILNPGKFHYICTIHVEIVHVYAMCMCIYIYIGMCYLCTIHIIAAYTSTNKENAGPSMSVSVYIYNYIYMHMDMAYATTMLPILQGALETSVFT